MLQGITRDSSSITVRMDFLLLEGIRRLYLWDLLFVPQLHLIIVTVLHLIPVSNVSVLKAGLLSHRYGL